MESVVTQPNVWMLIVKLLQAPQLMTLVAHQSAKVRQNLLEILVLLLVPVTPLSVQTFSVTEFHMARALMVVRQEHVKNITMLVKVSISTF